MTHTDPLAPSVQPDSGSLIGPVLAITGSAIATIGVIANNILLDHILAMQIWVVSNVLLLVWAYGYTHKWWNNALSGMALVVMYAVMLVSGVWGLLMQ